MAVIYGAVGLIALLFILAIYVLLTVNPAGIA